jgi:hypothetical protein
MLIGRWRTCPIDPRRDHRRRCFPPTGAVALAGNADATVDFLAPFANGSPITSYTVTAEPGGATVTGTSSPITVTDLVNGTAYTFSVTATNALGTSLPSAPSSAVTR